MKSTKTLLVSIMAALSLNFAAGCVDDSNEDDIESAQSSAEDPKFDVSFIDLPARELQISPPDSQTEYVKIIRSQKQFEALLGTTTSEKVDFSKEWVAVYAAGARPTSGYTAHMNSIIIIDGKLKVNAGTQVPSGAACIVSQVVTFPSVVVKFKKPTAPFAKTIYTAKAEPFSCKQDF
jgi:hypothetical protein